MRRILARAAARWRRPVGCATRWTRSIESRLAIRYARRRPPARRYPAAVPRHCSGRAAAAPVSRAATPAPARMKCPKCGYLGFETTERCRNCGYDFSLSQHASAPRRNCRCTRWTAPARRSPISNFGSGPRRAARTAACARSRRADWRETVVAAPRPAPWKRRRGRRALRHAAGAAVRRKAQPRAEGESPGRRVGLPLFTPGSARRRNRATRARRVRAGAPLSVRRSTPDVPRGRSARPSRPQPRREEPPPALQLEPTARPGRPNRSADPASRPPAATGVLDAGQRPRVVSVAATFDLILLGAVNAAVLYFTLAIAGLADRRGPAAAGDALGRVSLAA